MEKYYFIGIKGAGMSALACLLFDNENFVTGCDYEEDFYTTEALEKRGVKIQTFEEAKITKDMTVIVGNAFVNHIFVDHLIEDGYTLYTYSRFLGILSKEYFSIAISGSHGKTTTTNLCRQVLSKQEHVNYVVGDGMGGGDPMSKTFIFEACEYKRNFLNYFPNIAIITNIDYDHPDYYKDIEDVKDAFDTFINQSKFLIYNGDDENLKEISKKVPKKLSFGLNEDNNFYATNIKNDHNYTTFDVYCNKKFFDTIKIPLFGKHNVYNTLASIAFTLYMGVKKKDIRLALEEYKKSKRRFEIFQTNEQIIISDYAHHPTEIRATLEALRAKYQNKMIICVFEPHTFSRTKAFIQDFQSALEEYDKVYLKEIFTSVREKDETISIHDLSVLIRNCEVITDHNLEILSKYKDAVIVFMGAGNIDKTANLYYKIQIK